MYSWKLAGVWMKTGSRLGVDWKQTGSRLDVDWKQTGKRLQVVWKQTGKKTGSRLKVNWKKLEGIWYKSGCDEPNIFNKKCKRIENNGCVEKYAYYLQM